MSAASRLPARRGSAFFGGLALLAAAAWALWPLHGEPVQLAAVREPAPEPREQRPLDAAAFRQPLWVAAPAPPTPVAALAPTPPPPLRLQLVAIVRQDGALRAALYDPDADTLRCVGAGETIAGRRVDAVTDADVRLVEGAINRTISLRPPELHP